MLTICKNHTEKSEQWTGRQNVRRNGLEHSELEESINAHSRRVCANALVQQQRAHRVEQLLVLRTDARAVWMLCRVEVWMCDVWMA